MADPRTRSPREEIERMMRVCDQMATMHASMAEKYGRRTLLLDLGLLAAAVWLNAMVFADDAIQQALTPLGMDSPLWLGLLAIAVFLLSVAEVRLDWRSLGSEHRKAQEFYSRTKIECRRLLSDPELLTAAVLAGLSDKYAAGGDMVVKIPERHFNRLKKKHKLKVLVSRYLDRHPGVSLLWLRIRLWRRDNASALPAVNAEERAENN